jgi:hypothetical protein
MEALKKWLTVTVVAVLLIVVGIIWTTVERRSYESQLTELRNAIANRDTTIETSIGVFQKLAIQHGNLSVMLDAKDVQQKALLEELKKGNEKVLVANKLAAYWKGAYEGLADAGQHHEDGGVGNPGRDVVDFTKDFGYIFVTGHTKTNPPEAYIKLEQRRPLRIILTVSQKEDDSWVTRATSSEENISIDIQSATINPKVLDHRWYERLGLVGDLAGGSDGLLGGIGVSAQFGKFEVGPKVYAAWPVKTMTNKEFAVWYGIGIIWHPFGR